MLQFYVFEWDEEKAQSNSAKHAVTFDEAATAFRDRLSSTVPDPQHSDDEERFALIGQSSAGRLLVVIHADRGDKIRIISARVATRHERKQYEDGE